MDEERKLQAEYQALLDQQVQQAQQAEEEARLAPLIEAVKREDESDWHNWDAMDVIGRVGAGALPIAGTVLGGLSTLPTGGIGGAIAGGGLGSIAGTALNSEIAKKDAYDYQQALNALNEARGQGITQTPEQAVDIARQKTGIKANWGNTTSNLLFDALGGLIGGGGMAQLAGKAGAGIGGKILGAVAGRPADYAVNAVQGALLPQTQENPTFEGDYGTERNGWEASGIGLGAGLGLSGLGHAGSAVLKQGLKDKINLGGKSDVAGLLPSRLDNYNELVSQQEMQGYMNRAKALQREKLFGGELDDKQFVKPQTFETSTGTNILDVVEQQLGRQLTDEQKLQLIQNPRLIQALQAEGDILSQGQNIGYMPNYQGLNLRNEVQDLLASDARTWISKSSNDIAGYLPSRELPLLETGIDNSEQLLRQEQMANYIARTQALQKQEIAKSKKANAKKKGK